MKDDFDNTLLIKANYIARKHFGIKYLKPFQTLVIQHILEQEEENEIDSTLAILPTGGGKSLCFLIPALAVSGITIIVYPLLSLMHDQASILDKNKIPYLLIKGGLNKYDTLNKLRNMRKTKIIITNVEMLSLGYIINELKCLDISLLVVDEVHTILGWGKTFRPSYLKLKEINNSIKSKQIIAFTATLSKSEITELSDCLFSSKPYIVFGGLNKENICYNYINSLFPLPDIITILKKENHLPAIVFTNSRAKTKIISDAI